MGYQIRLGTLNLLPILSNRAKYIYNFVLNIPFKSYDFHFNLLLTLQ